MKQHTGCPPDRPDRDKTPSAPPEPAHAEAKKTSSRIKRIFSLFKRKKPQPPAPETAAPPCPKPPSAEEISEMPARFERLMTVMRSIGRINQDAVCDRPESGAPLSASISNRFRLKLREIRCLPV